MKGRHRWGAQMSRRLVEWVQGQTDHRESTRSILELALDGPEISEQCFATSRILGALGLFEAALTYEERGLQCLHNGTIPLPLQTRRLREVQSAIHRGARVEAIAAVRQFRLRHKSEAKLPASVFDLLHYVDVWANLTEMDSFKKIERENPSWYRFVSDSEIALIGPGPIHYSTKRVEESAVVARVAGPGSYSWQSSGDIASGRTEIVYLNPETLVSLGSTEAKRHEKVKHFQFLCIKRGDAPYIQNSRRVSTGSRLFLRGHPNMIPLAILDLLRIPGSSVNVIASNFFASGHSYRSDSIRITPEGLPQSHQGSTGRRYDRSTLMASHNPFQNRRLVKNLLDSGRLTGDNAFLEACSLPDLEYARTLDLHYGIDKL